MTPRATLLRQLSAAAFVLFDLHLYLDTHPAEPAAMALYNNYKAKAALLRREFEEKYGALSLDDAAGIDWFKNPWPWDLEGSGMNV